MKTKYWSLGVLSALVWSAQGAMGTAEHQDPAQEVAQSKPAPRRAVPPAAVLRLDLMNQRLAAQEVEDVFAVPVPPVVRHKPVAVAPVEPVAMPAPVAPPLPFIFMGKLDDGEKLSVFLVDKNHLYTVVAGDVVEEVYRVESIQRGLITFTYLPLNTPQTLNMGNDS